MAGNSATSAYGADGREGWREREIRDHGWHPAFNRLLSSGYLFLDAMFSEDGMLFRGMPAGSAALLAGDRFWHSPDDNPLSRLERDLKVLFCSQMARDALAVARPWQNPGAVILVFPAAIFRRRWRERSAAMLGFADVGMVFRYPCLAEPLCLSDLAAMVVHPDELPACRARLRELPASARPLLLAPAARIADRRESWAVVIEQWLAETDNTPAEVVAAGDYPQRIA